MECTQLINTCGPSPRCIARTNVGQPNSRTHATNAPSTDTPYAVRVTSSLLPGKACVVRLPNRGHTSRSSRCKAVASLTTSAPVPEALSSNLPSILAVGALALLIIAIKKIYDTPTRTYSGNVGEEYDSWAQEGILEYYWGEHIHLGYYTAEERRIGYKKKDFKKAKLDFIDEMLKWTGVQQPKRILDVGCGIGGTTRHLASKFPDAEIIGITLSPKQVERATQLAASRGLTNCKFMVMDALAMTFEANTFDLVWGCESGEHMPNKKKYVEQMTRVLAPHGVLAIATWCQREETKETPFSDKDRSALQFLYDEWAHPYFISYEEYGRLLEGTSAFQSVTCEDWTEPTLPSWRHSNWVGVWDPWPVVFKFNPFLWYKVTREIVTIERFHRAFARGLMTYGMIKGTKKSAEDLKQLTEEQPAVMVA